MRTFRIRPRSRSLLLSLALLVGAVPWAHAGQVTLLELTASKGTHLASFDVPGDATAYRVTAVCGGEQSGTRLSSAVVWINDRPVLRPRDFNQKVDEITRAVDGAILTSSANRVEVEVDGNPSSVLQLVVIATRPDRPMPRE